METSYCLCSCIWFEIVKSYLVYDQTRNLRSWELHWRSCTFFHLSTFIVLTWWVFFVPWLFVLRRRSIWLCIWARARVLSNRFFIGVTMMFFIFMCLIFFMLWWLMLWLRLHLTLHFIWVVWMSNLAQMMAFLGDWPLFLLHELLRKPKSYFIYYCD